jgi:hypothetical protein
MLLSRTNNSLQQHISSSDSSSLIGPHQNPDCNAHAKAHSYKVGDDSSDFGTDCTSSDESAMVDDNFRMNTGYGRYGAAYNMVGLRCFNEELSLLTKNPTEAKLQATSTWGESTEPT